MSNLLENIKVLALDVDGVLTDGTIAFAGSKLEEMKSFHVHDGLGISIWQKAGFHTILISGRNAQCVTARAKELNIAHLKQGSTDKITDLIDILEDIRCSPAETCFVGDDLGDIDIMQYVGYSIASQNAVQEVKDIAQWTTPRKGGHGAVRDAVEHIMNANGLWLNAVSTFHSEHAIQ